MDSIKKESISHSALTCISLVASASTLFCCTLPVIMSVVGLGALLTVYGIYFNWISAFTLYKFLFFLISGILLFVSSLILRIPLQECPLDPKLQNSCKKARIINIWLLRMGISFWFIGFFITYLSLPLALWME